MENFHFLTDFFRVLAAGAYIPTGFDKQLIDQFEASFLLAEIEGGGGLLRLVEKNCLFSGSRVRGFGLRTGFFEIGEEFRHESLLLGEFLECCLFLPLELGF